MLMVVHGVVMSNPFLGGVGLLGGICGDKCLSYRHDLRQLRAASVIILILAVMEDICHGDTLVRS